MNKTAAFLIAAAIVVGVAPLARSLGTPTPPKGVVAGDWIPMGDTAGFVVTHERQNWGGGAPHADAVKGYFVVRRDGAWRRVEATAEPDVHSASLQ